MPDGKEGRSEDQTPPYKERAPSFTSSPFMKRGAADAFVHGGRAEVGLGHPQCPPPRLVGFPSKSTSDPTGVTTATGALIGAMARTLRCSTSTHRLAIARTQLASNELQLRIERLGGWPGRRRREEGGREGE